MSLTEYIKINFGGNQAAFARHMGVRPQKVTDWINASWLVIDHQLCSPRREIPPIA
nr:helix-turn-helix domain-containing protein [Pectobacterium carotovorum]